MLDKRLYEILENNKANLIFANIVADVIISFAPHFKNFLKAGGSLIVSGIIKERSDEVVSALRAAGFNIISIKNADGWCSIHLK